MVFRLLLFLFVLHPTAFGADDVIEYTDSDFDSKMHNHDTALVMFYAPWCGHCQHLKPEYSKAAQDLTADDSSVALVKVDCTDSGKATCDKYQVDGYPSLKVFRNGKYAQDYDGPRTSDGIVDFMKNRVGPKFKQLTNAEEVADFIAGGGGEVRVVGYFDGDTAFKESFFRVAEEMFEKVGFGYEEGVEEESLVLYRPPLLRNKFEEDRVVYEGKAKSEEMQDFIVKNYHGLVGHRKPNNREDFSTPLVVAYYHMDYRRDPKGTSYWRNRVLRVAQQYKNRVNFAVSNKEDFQEDMNEYGLENYESAKPIVFGFDDKSKRYVMEDQFSSENLTKFVQELLDGKLERTIRSEPIPSVDDGPVKVAVAKNFDKIVRDNGKDTLLAFYAPWCGHCKKLAPVYEELAITLKNEEVEVVKMDATANEVPPEFHISDYPTLYWLPKEKKNEPVLYKGKKEPDAVIKYVAEHATNELKGYDRHGNVRNIKIEL